MITDYHLKLPDVFKLLLLSDQKKLKWCKNHVTKTLLIIPVLID